jgi:hypothetical protein
VRFSKGAAAYADIVADLPRPDQRFARSCSLDSPTLYEFPDQRALLASASPLNEAAWPASPDPSRPYVCPGCCFLLPDSVPVISAGARVMWCNAVAISG